MPRPGLVLSIKDNVATPLSQSCGGRGTLRMRAARSLARATCHPDINWRWYRFREVENHRSASPSVPPPGTLPPGEHVHVHNVVSDYTPT